jgi:hypothetical protein
MEEAACKQQAEAKPEKPNLEKRTGRKSTLLFRNWLRVL